jgi:ribosomal 30S subunit maturation factor RimM
VKGGFFLLTVDRKPLSEIYKSVYQKDKNGDFSCYEILNSYMSRGHTVWVLKGLESREDIQSRLGTSLFVNKTEIKIQEDEVSVSELIGLFVSFDCETAIHGKVVGVSSFGAQDNLEILIEGKEESIFYPFLDKYVLEIDNSSSKIRLSYLKEFLDD